MIFLILVILVLVLVFVVIAQLYIYKRYNPLKDQLMIIAAKILNSNIQISRDKLGIVRGEHKGRKIELGRYLDAGRYSGQSGIFYKIDMTHFGVFNKKSYLIPSRPTKDTFLINNKIEYDNPTSYIFSNCGPGFQYNEDVNIIEQKLINIFDKLAEAAIVVEQGRPFYAKGF